MVVVVGGGRLLEVIDWAPVVRLSWMSPKDLPIHQMVHTREERLPDGQHCFWATPADVWNVTFPKPIHECLSFCTLQQL